MDAPEKIYYHKGKLRTPFAVEQRLDETDIEYIRTDAFIEKAKKWFDEHTNIPQEIETNEEGEPLADSYINYAKARLDAAKAMFEDFKNFMKGE